MMIISSFLKNHASMSNNSTTTIRVAKFGGTSVADFDAMNCSIDIILANSAVRLVVLSASAGVTNLLVALSEGNEEKLRSYYLNEIRRIQYNIINRLDKQTVIRKKIDQMIDHIAMLAEAASLATSLALTDELASYGELISTLLFVEVLRQRGVLATWFDIRKVMHTNDQFGHAEPDSYILKMKTCTLLLPRLKNELIITQGFIGSEAKGRTTTLGRGGSDYTATLLGEALDAERIDIWTDVSGIYTTDPSVIPQAKRIDEISFEEASEMAIFGAKILHPATLLPIVRSAIPLFIGSSKEPTAGGTLVYNHNNNRPLFRALTLRRHQMLVTLHSLKMLHNKGFLAEVFNILAQHEISVDLITTSKISIAITMDDTSPTITGINLLTQELLTKLSSLCQVEIEKDLALIALIGNKLLQIYGVAKKVFSILDSFNIRLICYGASNYNICLLVHSSDADQVLKLLHDALFN